MKVAFFELEAWEKEHLKSQFPGVTFLFFEERLSLDSVNSCKDSDIISIFIDSQPNKELLGQLSNLKMISTRSTGFDHIDMEACKARGIVVCNVPFYGENTVAEHTFALILDLSRKIHQSIERVRKGHFSAQGLQGFDLKGKKLGIIGMGHIGQHVARMAQGFEMEVLGFDVKPDKRLAKKLNFTYLNLDELLKNADIISLHVPYNPHTHHLLNAGNMALIKKGAYLINTARGGLIETDALVKSLGNGTLAGAALDVLEEECYIKEEGELLSEGFSQKCDLKTMLQNHVLMQQENVIITPHNAFNSKEALERILDTTIENIKAFMAGKPINTVS